MPGPHGTYFGPDNGVSTVLARYGLSEPTDWMERRLRAGDCIVLLDGLDEVARQEDRQAVSDWVTVQVTRYPGNDFVVTSRPLGYQSAPIEGAITVQTRPFTSEQINRFVHGWCLAEERHSAGLDDHDITRRALPRPRISSHGCGVLRHCVT